MVIVYGHYHFIVRDIVRNKKIKSIKCINGGNFYEYVKER